MGGITEIIDLMLVACGVYFLYAWISMKKTGQINKTILLGSSYDAKRCKDTEEYLTYVMPKVLITGIITLITGVGSLLNDMYLKNTIVGYAVTVIFFAVLIWYVILTGKAARKYF